MNINDTIEGLVDAGFGLWSGYGTRSGQPFEDARTVRVTLPDNKIATKHTSKDYAYVLAVDTPDGWKPFRWVIREHDLPKVIAAANDAGFNHTQTLNVEEP